MSSALQGDASNTLSHASFIYHIEDLTCVSHIVVVPKKDDIDFKPLNDSTKRDQLSLHFQDEILDEIVVYARQGNVEILLGNWSLLVGREEPS